MTKKHILLITAILSLSMLSACSGKTAEIRDDVAVSDVSAEVSTVLGDDTLVAVPETFYTGAMKMDVSQFDGYEVRINSKGINIDEFGVFKAKDSSQVSVVEQTVKDYLKMRVDTWMVEYMPEEKPKLDNAEVRTIGNYVMYAILSDDNKSAAFDAFNKSLTK